MKKFMQTVGILGAVLLFTGSIFKQLDWPGGGAVVALSWLILAMLYIPTMFIVNYKASVNRLEKSMNIFGSISAWFMIGGIVFKLMHWPGASFSLTIGSVLFILGFLPLYISKSKKEDYSIPSNPLHMVVGLLIICSLFFSVQNMGDTNYFMQHFDEMNQQLSSKIERVKEERQTDDSNVNEKVHSLELAIQSYKLNWDTYTSKEGSFLTTKVALQICPIHRSVKAGKDFDLTKIDQAIIDLKKSVKDKSLLGFELNNDAQTNFEWLSKEFKEMPLGLIYFRLTQLENELAILQL